MKQFSEDHTNLLYTKDTEIRRLDTNTGKASEYVTLDFAPRCFDELDNILVAGGVQTHSDPMGGWKGQYGIYSKDRNLRKSFNLGSLINNSVSMHKDSNYKYTSFACNNDQSLYSLELNDRGMEATGSIDLEFPLNNSCLSPDRNTLAVCGDVGKVVLLRRDEGFTHSSRKETIATNHDCGFSIDFNPSGLYMATAFQEGTCLIHDVRNLKSPLHSIVSTRRNCQSGAFRRCKFSGSTDDLLFISEHTSRVHMVDVRDYNNHQVVVLPPCVNDMDQLLEPVVKTFDQVTRSEDNFHGYPMVLELIGLEWMGTAKGNCIVIGTENGIIKWDINSWTRRCFPGYDVC